MIGATNARTRPMAPLVQAAGTDFAHRVPPACGTAARQWAVSGTPPPVGLVEGSGGAVAVAVAFAGGIVVEPREE